MGDTIPQIKPKTLVKILERLGFTTRRQTGSHLILKHPLNKKTIVVPMHAKDIKRGLLFGILKQAEIPQEKFLKFL